MEQMQQEASANGLTSDVFEDVLSNNSDEKREALKAELKIAFSSPDSDYLELTADDIISPKKG